MNQANLPGDSIGYINFAPFLIRTAVIDAYQFKLAVAGIHYADERPKGEVGVSRSKRFAVEALAIGGFAAIEPGAIPTRVTHPGLNRLHRLIQMRYEGGFHARGDQEHEEYPPQCSPAHE